MTMDVRYEIDPNGREHIAWEDVERLIGCIEVVTWPRAEYQAREIRTRRSAKPLGPTARHAVRAIESSTSCPGADMGAAKRRKLAGAARRPRRADRQRNFTGRAGAPGR
jgi:hypothetical protein